MKRSHLLTFAVMAALLTVGFSPALDPPERDLIRMGPITSANWCGDSTCMLFGATSLIRTPSQRFLSGHHQVAVHVDIYRDGALYDTAEGTGPIQLAESSNFAIPDRYALVQPVQASWDHDFVGDPFCADLYYSVSLLDQHDRVLSTDAYAFAITMPIGGGCW